VKYMNSTCRVVTVCLFVVVSRGPVTISVVSLLLLYACASCAGYSPRGV